MGIEKESRFPIVKGAAKLSGVFALLYSIYYIGLGDFTSAQVDAIKKRDKDKCQYPGCKNKTKYNVEVHHISTQGYSVRINDMRPDSPFNAVCLCEEHHIGHPKKDHKKSEKQGNPVYRDQQAGMNWDPIHPDSYLLHLVLVGKFEKLPAKLKQQIDADFPDLYEYYAGVNEEKKENRLDYKQLYKVVMRKWRSDKLDDKQVYWNTRYDHFLHIAAITNTLKSMRNGWKFPRRMIGGRVKAINRGTYSWDNLISMSIERYVQRLSKSTVNRIFKKMKNPKYESRIVYYEEIYVPATRSFENKINMAGMLNHYLNSFSEKEQEKFIQRIDKARKKKNFYTFLMNELYTPALALHHSHGGKTLPKYTRTGNAGSQKKKYR